MDALRELAMKRGEDFAQVASGLGYEVVAPATATASVPLLTTVNDSATSLRVPSLSHSDHPLSGGQKPPFTLARPLPESHASTLSGCLVPSGSASSWCVAMEASTSDHSSLASPMEECAVPFLIPALDGGMVAAVDFESLSWGRRRHLTSATSSNSPIAQEGSTDSSSSHESVTTPLSQPLVPSFFSGNQHTAVPNVCNVPNRSHPLAEDDAWHQGDVLPLVLSSASASRLPEAFPLSQLSTTSASTNSFMSPGTAVLNVPEDRQLEPPAEDCIR